MASNFQKKTSGIFLTLLIGLIVISFAITGYQGGSAPTTAIAKVGDYTIESKEYQTGLNNLLRFYAQIYNGGKDLSSAQIKNMQLRQRVLGQLIDQKIMLTFANDIGISASPAEIKSQIKDFSQNGKKVFYTGDTFDLAKYKALLASNGLTPTDFENETKTRIEIEKVKDVLLNYPLSDNYLKKIKNLKGKIIEADVAYFSKMSLQEFVPISKKEIDEYLKDENNLKKVQQQFERSKNRFSNPEKVKASHILIMTNEEDAEKKINDLAKKVTPKNFAQMAKKHTQDPSGKDNGGKLGWFTKGKMVPEFDKAVFTQEIGTISKPIKTQFGYHLVYLEGKMPAYEATFEKHKDQVTKEILQGEKSDTRDKIANTLKTQIFDSLSKGNIKKAKQIAKNHKITFNDKEKYNEFDGLKLPLKLKNDQLKSLFNNEKVHLFEDNVYTVIIKSKKSKDKPKDEDNTLEKISAAQNQNYTLALNNEIQKIYRGKTNIKVYRNVEN
ncbi:MAG: SurA N-terminal domain-containing protein [Bdellovibrionales bacterium]|nr:SurA N-terminal domain-containing protein [Bdellovibrionales bacterium]